MDNQIAPTSPRQEQPSPKKLKMSTTTSDDEEHNPAGVVTAADGTIVPRQPRYKRRKIAIFFAYCGVGYQGMQKNPGAKTIEGELEEALYKVGAVPEQDKYKPRLYDWARSARTDKGVSAVGQVVSGRFYVDPPGFIERLNSILPTQFRIFGYKRVIASFNAKKLCDRRRYVYLVPLFALDPSAHCARETVLASLGSENELSKCLECSERGRKVIGVMGKRSFELKFEAAAAASEPGIMSNNGDAPVTLQNMQSNINSLDNGDMVIENGAPLSEKVEERSGEVERCDENAKTVKKSEFCYGEAEKERFNRILKHYEGTHNFHNFTTRTKAEDPAAKRYIISFTANTIVNVQGIDFVKCEVMGQSFMLHQIRKMIGLAVAIMRNLAPESLIETAYRRDTNIVVPMAPEVGLYLDECFFTNYNNKWKGTHEEVSMTAYSEEAEDFKMKYIYSHIASAEQQDGWMALWLHSLNHRNYPDSCVLSGGNSAGAGAGAGAGAKDAETVVENGVGVVNNGESTYGRDVEAGDTDSCAVNGGNSVVACAGAKDVEAVIEDVVAVNNGESTEARIVEAGDVDLCAVDGGNTIGASTGAKDVEAVVRDGVGVVNNGESTDAKIVEAVDGADLVKS